MTEPAAPDDSCFYYLDNQDPPVEQGPYSAEEIRAWRAAGFFESQTKFRCGGTDGPFSDIDDFPALRVATLFSEIKGGLEPMLAQLGAADPPDREDEVLALRDILASLEQACASCRSKLAQSSAGQEGGWKLVSPAPEDEPEENSQLHAETCDVADEADLLAEGIAKISFDVKQKKKKKPPKEAKAEPITPAEAPVAAPSPARVPRRPRLVVVVDTNEIIAAPAHKLDRNHLLQDCEAVDVILPRQVVDELDGLKENKDVAVASSARRANKLLSEASRADEPWLRLEKQNAATEARHRKRPPDERVLKCILNCKELPQEHGVHLADRVILATSDKNLQLRAMMAGVEAKPLEQVRSEAKERDRCWHAAYSGQLAELAIQRAGWSHAG